MSTGRIETLDVAKGLGIVLVVLGHNAVFREDAHPVYEAIYLFHMPLFFFLSGVTFRPGILRRARALLVPYFAMGAVALAMAVNAGGLEAGTNELKGILYGTGHMLRFVPLWFLPCLFVVSMAATLLLRSVKRALILSSIACVGLVIGTAILSSQVFAHAPWIDATGRPLGLPWSLDLLPLVLGIFVVGTLAARVPHVFRFPQPWIVMLATAGVLAAMVAYGVSLDLNYRRMTHPLLVLIAMSAGVAMVLAAATLITRVTWASRLFSYLGSASLILFMLHSPLQRRLIDALVARDVNHVTVVIASAALAIAAICAFDRWILRRIRAIGWVVYPRALSPA